MTLLQLGEEPIFDQREDWELRLDLSVLQMVCAHEWDFTLTTIPNAKPKAPKDAVAIAEQAAERFADLIVFTQEDIDKSPILAIDERIADIKHQWLEIAEDLKATLKFKTLKGTNAGELTAMKIDRLAVLASGYLPKRYDPGAKGSTALDRIFASRASA